MSSLSRRSSAEFHGSVLVTIEDFPLQISGQPLRPGDVAVASALSRFITAQRSHGGSTSLNTIDTVAGTEIDPHLRNARAHRFHIAKTRRLPPSDQCGE